MHRDHEFPKDLRLILFHRQLISARLQFLRFTHSIYALEPLPLSAALTDSKGTMVYHPSFYLPPVEKYLGLPQGSLRREPAFQETVHTLTGHITIYLTRCTTLDPPSIAMTAMGGKFISITEAKGCSSLELELLRRAYTLLN